ncbi:uncharacterized protein LMUH8_0865 [Listeria monocytogenes]|nr:uncharacterized protein LMMT_0821 [Listeria monocytogenes]QNK22686.1 uncharacterized protein LMUH4_0864 [Listeria monocytogenes]QNK25564.1 uncharacterized protein LMUH8_0865 [Listeria monocytogenes]
MVTNKYMGNQLISMKKGKGKEVCFVFLFSLPQRTEGADTPTSSMNKVSL